MKLAIMQPYFFPYIGYWQLIHQVDKFVIYDDVNYRPRTYINRNTILANCQEKRITLALAGASQNKKIRQLEIVGDTRKLSLLISTAYKNAPYFEKAMPFLEDLICRNEVNLAKYLGDSIVDVSSYLNLNSEFVYSSDLKNNKDLKGQDKIIDICKLLGAKTYVNAIGGRELYNRVDFEEQGIVVNFIKTKITPYEQSCDRFFPSLSIIDVLMNNSLERIDEMMSCYDLV